MADITEKLHIEKSLFYKQVYLEPPYVYYAITHSDLYKPYLVAENNGLDKSYWKLILRANKVTNPFNLQEGQLLIIPKSYELENAFSSIQRP